jgi:tetratricopeptide (TPR) repeat protein
MTMSRKRASQILGVSLFLFLLRCFAQSSPSHRQEIELHNRQAQNFLGENRPDLAIPEFRAILAIDRNNVDALGNLGVLLFFQGDYTQAIPPFRAALKLRPTLWKIRALLGVAEKRTGNYSGARADLESALPRIQEEKIRIEAGMELIELYSGSGDLEKAASVVDGLGSLYPTNPQVQYTSYRIHSDLAAQAMLSLSMVAPKSALMHQVMAHELARQGDTTGAITNYREALKIDPQLPGLHFELAEMLNASGSQEGQEEAKKEYEAALAVDKFDEKSEYKLGEIAYREGSLEESFAHYSRAVQLQPDDVDANIGLAKALVEMKQPQKAQSLLEHALQMDPTSAVGHFRLSILYRQAGRTEDAKRELLEYQKYKDMKEKLRNIYQEMRLQPAKQEPDEADSRK